MLGTSHSATDLSLIIISEIADNIYCKPACVFGDAQESNPAVR